MSQEIFRIAPEKLGEQQINVLRALQKEAQRGLKYYHSTMHVFDFPEKRAKGFDTAYYEKVLPIIDELLNNIKVQDNG